MTSERAQARKMRTAHLRAIAPQSRAVVKARAARYANVANNILAGLEHGKAFHWKGSESHLIGIAEHMGFTLVTLSRAESAGWTLKKQQKPVGSVYYEAPISKSYYVYVLECQFNRAEEPHNA
jgi:hypothetical protein